MLMLSLEECNTVKSRVKEFDKLDVLVRCSNKALANLMSVPLVGCASHRLALAIKAYLEPHEPLLSKVFFLSLLLLFLSILLFTIC